MLTSSLQFRCSVEKTTQVLCVLCKKNTSVQVNVQFKSAEVLFATFTLTGVASHGGASFI